MLSILPILPTPLATLLSSDTKAIRKTNHGYIGRIDNPLCGNTLHVIDVVIRRRNISKFVPEFDKNDREMAHFT